MLDTRATQIVSDVTRLLGIKPLADIKQCQDFVEHGTPGNSTFEPTVKSDTIARFYMRKTVLKLMTTYLSEKVDAAWIKQNTEKLSEEYRSISSRAGHLTDFMEADALTVGPSSGLITSGFVLAGYGNSFVAKVFAAITLFCLAYLVSVLLLEQQQKKLPVEQRITPTSLSTLARNFLFPNSRLSQDSRLLGRLNDEIDALLDNIKNSHRKKL